ncbi:MAG: NOL1/NOP2/sun family putative RNA methylase [Gemmatimonadetes bacterium]|nr:NOL1/NOP2/sun family putative RNA methylase [Gemmatimonadota bacterium]
MNKDTTPKTRKEQIPKAEKLEALLAHLGNLLPDDAQRCAFRACSTTPPPASLRLNKLIPQSRSLLPALAKMGEPAPWCPESFALQEPESRLAHCIEYALGTFYIQAKAPTLAVEVLDPQPGERVLDMCAAPGGKATQIAAHMKNSGLLVVNEPHRKRLPALIGHLERCGVTNAVVGKGQGTMLARYFHNYFDRILLDAPCSGDGIVRKDQSMLRYWSVKDATHQAEFQIGLIRAAFHMLRPGGILVYSTCSLSLEENEEVLLGLLHKREDQVDIQPIEIFESLPLPEDIATRFPPSFTGCARIWPHLHDTEGAFVARIGKREETEWRFKEGDAETWTEEEETTPETIAVVAALEKQWRFDLPCPPDHLLATDHRHLWLRHRVTAAFKEHFPFYIRGGMRVGRRHRAHYYLSQQAVSMWGALMETPRLELTWEQLQQFFQGEPVELPEPTPLRGEVLCDFDSRTICRGILESQGRILRGMVPREHYRADLERLS